MRAHEAVDGGGAFEGAGEGGHVARELDDHAQIGLREVREQHGVIGLALDEPEAFDVAGRTERFADKLGQRAFVAWGECLRYHLE